MSDSLQTHGLYSPWNSPGQNTAVRSCSLLQGIFPTQGSNPGLWHCRQILCQLSPKGSPRILEWVAYPFSYRSSQPRNQTGVSCIAGRFFTSWATREAPPKMGTTGNSKSKSSIQIVFSNLLTFFLGYFSTYVQTWTHTHTHPKQQKFRSVECRGPFIFVVSTLSVLLLSHFSRVRLCATP